ncbi:MAG: LptF/LptG family permease [Planctomycetaceae bacterium]|jgi:lipopolysaccharide export system permease protein|nr:LptF/LptG family permease [Planctomycetaceae bacterium]
MSIIVRYILRELGLTFLFGFVAFTCLLLIVGLVREASDNHIPLTYIWMMVPFVFAEMSPISLPVSLLLAVTIFFAKMSGNNEVIALKSLGIPPKTFLVPVFVIAFIFSLIAVGINELAITYGRQGISMMLERGAKNMLMEPLKKVHRFERKSDDQLITIIVKGVDEEGRLIDPKIILKKEAVTIEARTAEFSIDFKAGFLTATFFDFRATAPEGRIVGGKRTLEIPLSEILPTRGSNSPSGMGWFQIINEQKNAAQQIDRQRRIIAAHRAFGAGMGSVDAWATSPIAGAKNNIRGLQTFQNRMAVELPRRWATGFCCFFFVWLGAPMAIWMRKSDFFASFFACFVPILILFFPLFIFGLNQAKRGSLPPISVWTADAALGIIGLWFLRQIHRY